MHENRYPYKPDWKLMLACGLVMGFLCYWMWGDLHAPPHGLNINGLITLSPGQARIFTWVWFVLFLLLMMCGLLGLYVALFGATRYLILTETALHMPKGLYGGREQIIPYREITGLRVLEVSNNRFLEVRYHGGKVNISQTLLPSKDDFSTVCAMLGVRAGG